MPAIGARTNPARPKRTPAGQAGSAFPRSDDGTGMTGSDQSWGWAAGGAGAHSGTGAGGAGAGMGAGARTATGPGSTRAAVSPGSAGTNAGDRPSPTIISGTLGALGPTREAGTCAVDPPPPPPPLAPFPTDVAGLSGSALGRAGAAAVREAIAAGAGARSAVVVARPAITEGASSPRGPRSAGRSGRRWAPRPSQASRSLTLVSPC